MSELAAELSAKTMQFLDGERTDVQRMIHRGTVVDMDGTDVTIEQHKFVGSREMKLVRAKGARALATVEWFNDVDWMKRPGKKRQGTNDLMLNVVYPLAYFDVPPTSGAFVESEDGRCWFEQYGSMSGFGNGKKITRYLPRFVAPGDHFVTELVYPEDPNAMEAYNARFRQYMDTLNSADPVIGYRRAWDLLFSTGRENPARTLGGLSLAGLSLDEVVQRGEFSEDEVGDATGIVLHDESRRTEYMGRWITIRGDEVTTEPYWHGEKERGPASDELLATALELVSAATIE